MCLKVCVMIHMRKLVSHVSSHVTQTEYATYSVGDSCYVHHVYQAANMATRWAMGQLIQE